MVDTASGTPDVGQSIWTRPRWGRKEAVYAGGSGTAELVFAHEVVEPNYSTQGIAVLADSLALGGGSIRSVSSGADAVVGHAGLDHDAGHKVDWRRSPGDTTPPQLLYGEIDGAQMMLVFSELLDPDSVGGDFEVSRWTGSAWTSFSATGGAEVYENTVTVELGEGNPPATAGEQYRARYLWDSAADADALRDLAGNRVSVHETLPQGRQATQQLPLRNLTASPPSVTEVAVSSDAGTDATYALGESIRVAVTFSHAVTVDTAGGTPTLTIDMDPAAWGRKRAVYKSGSGTRTLTFVHEVVEPNSSTQGVAVRENSLRLRGGVIGSAASGLAAELGHAGLDHDPAHKVDWQIARDTSAPQLLSGDIDGTTVRLYFSEALDPDATGGEFMVQVQTKPWMMSSFRARGDVEIDGESGDGRAGRRQARSPSRPDRAELGVLRGALRPRSRGAAGRLRQPGQHAAPSRRAKPHTAREAEEPHRRAGRLRAGRALGGLGAGHRAGGGDHLGAARGRGRRLRGDRLRGERLQRGWFGPARCGSTIPRRDRTSCAAWCRASTASLQASSTSRARRASW